MTEANRKANLLLEFELSAQALRAATYLRDGGFPRDSVSRAYYAAYHGARALLLSEGLEPRTHAGTNQMLGLHFIRPGVLDERFSRLLSLLQAEREGADYQSALTYRDEDATRWLAEVEDFLRDVGSVLKAREYLEEADEPSF